MERIDPRTSIPDLAWPTLALLACSWSLAAGCAAAGVTGAWPWWAAVAGVALADYAAFTGMHEASHGLVGRDRPWLNQVCGEICAAMLLCRFNGFRQVHLRHHTFAGDPERDPDAYAGVGPAWQLPLRWATSDLNYWFQWDASIKQNRVEKVASDTTLVLLAAIVVAGLAAGYGAQMLLFWVLPARIALMVSTYFFDYLPHQRPHTVPRRVNPAQSSVVLKGGPVLDAVLLGHTLHLIHHLYPCVPSYKLRSVYRPRRSRLLAQGAREVWPFTRPRPYDAAATTPTAPANPASTAA